MSSFVTFSETNSMFWFTQIFAYFKTRLLSVVKLILKNGQKVFICNIFETLAVDRLAPISILLKKYSIFLYTLTHFLPYVDKKDFSET